MGAPKGNQYWRARSRHGRKKIFETPEDLWKACTEYFDWVEANPLKEQKINVVGTEVVKTDLNKMRAMTLTGLCMFLHANLDTWDEYRKRKDFTGVCINAEDTIYDQKLSGAGANLLNASIMARHLGLKDSQDHTHNVEGVTFNMHFGDE